MSAIRPYNKTSRSCGTDRAIAANGRKVRIAVLYRMSHAVSAFGPGFVWWIIGKIYCPDRVMPLHPFNRRRVNGSECIRLFHR